MLPSFGPLHRMCGTFIVLVVQYDHFMPQMPTHTPEPVFDAFWFPLFAEIVIPSLVGVATVVVAIVAVKLGADQSKERKAALLEQRRTSFSFELHEWITAEDRAERLVALAFRYRDVPGTAIIAEWFTHQANLIRESSPDSIDSLFDLESLRASARHHLAHEGSRRISAWLDRNEFDNSSIEHDGLLLND